MRKESVRARNRHAGQTSSFVMDSRPSFQAGEVVYLTAELRGGERIHEIGTRALVVAATGPELALELGSDVVACSARDVARARRPRPSVPTRARLRPATA